MKVLAISPQPFFSPRGTPLSVYYRTLVMAEHGATVDLLTYGQGADVDVDGVRIVRIPRFKLLGDVRVGPSFLKLFLDVVLLLRMIGLLVRNRYDFVHAHEEAVFFCLLLRPVFRFRFVYDMHSSLPQQLTSFEFTRSKAMIGLFEWLERKALEQATAVITICEDLYDYANTLIDAKKNILIENSLFDAVRVVQSGGPRDEPPKPPEYGERVVYAGTLEPYQGIDLLLEAFHEATKVRDDAGLIIAGGTPEQVAHYHALSSALGLDDRVCFLGSVSRDIATRLNSAADVLVSPRLTGGNTPLKIYEHLASGIPMVATRIHSHTQVLSDDVAFLAEPEPTAFANAIVTAISDSETARSKTARARELYDAEYSRASYNEKLIRVLEFFS